MKCNKSLKTVIPIKIKIKEMHSSIELFLGFSSCESHYRHGNADEEYAEINDHIYAGERTLRGRPMYFLLQILQ